MGALLFLAPFVGLFMVLSWLCVRGIRRLRSEGRDTSAMAMVVSLVSFSIAMVTFGGAVVLGWAQTAAVQRQVLEWAQPGIWASLGLGIGALLAAGIVGGPPRRH